MSTILPENILNKMDKKDRASLGKAGLTKEEVSDKVMIKNERELQNQIAGYLRLREIAFCRSRMDKKTTNTLGWPDFVFAIEGKPIAFECKMPGKKPDEEQIKCHNAMLKNGWHIHTIYSFDQAVDSINLHFKKTEII